LVSGASLYTKEPRCYKADGSWPPRVRSSTGIIAPHCASPAFRNSAFCTKERDDCPKAHALVSDYRFTAVLQAHQNLGGAANKESLQSIRKRWLRASTTIDDQTIRKMAVLDSKRCSIPLWIRTTTCISGVWSEMLRSI